MKDSKQHVLGLAKIGWSTLMGDKPLFQNINKTRFLLIAQGIYGLLWLEGASWKVLVDGKFALNYAGLSYWASRGSEYPVLNVYKWLTDHLILPNIKLLLPIVFVTELSIGLMLVFGKHVRIAALLAISQTILITLSALNTPGEWKWSYFLMLLVATIFFVMPTTSTWTARFVRRK